MDKQKVDIIKMELVSVELLTSMICIIIQNEVNMSMDSFFKTPSKHDFREMWGQVL